MASIETIKVALGAFAEKFRTSAQSIDEIDRDNPAILSAIKYTGGDLLLEPIILKTREPVYVSKPDGQVTLEGKDSEVVAVDAGGVPIYKVTLKCAASKENTEGVKAAAGIEMETIRTHAHTQNFHVLASIILGLWGATVIYFIVQALAGLF